MVDLERIKDLIALMKESGVTELSVDLPDYKVSIKRGDETPGTPAERAQAAASEPAQAEAPAPTEEEPGDDLITVTAPMVGIFCLGGTGDGRPLLGAGDQVEQGQVIAAIETMKVPNDITAPATGRIERVLVADGAPVEYGQALMRLRPEQEESP